MFLLKCLFGHAICNLKSTHKDHPPRAAQAFNYSRPQIKQSLAGSFRDFLSFPFIVLSFPFLSFPLSFPFMSFPIQIKMFYDFSGFHIIWGPHFIKGGGGVYY